MKYILVLCVCTLAAVGAYELWHEHQPEVTKAKDTAAKVGQVAEDTTRSVIKTTDRVVEAAKAAKENFDNSK